MEERFLKREQEMKVKLTLDKQCFVLVISSEQLAFESLNCAGMYFRRMWGDFLDLTCQWLHCILYEEMRAGMGGKGRASGVGICGHNNWI